MHNAYLLKKLAEIREPAERKDWLETLHARAQRAGEINKIFVEWIRSESRANYRWFFDRLGERYPNEARSKQMPKSKTVDESALVFR